MSLGAAQVPAVSYAIFKHNQNITSNTKINLKGLAVGNGLTDPGIQYGKTFVATAIIPCRLYQVIFASSLRHLG